MKNSFFTLILLLILLGGCSKKVDYNPLIIPPKYQEIPTENEKNVFDYEKSTEIPKISPENLELAQ